MSREPGAIGVAMNGNQYDVFQNDDQGKPVLVGSLDCQFTPESGWTYTTPDGRAFSDKAAAARHMVGG